MTVRVSVVLHRTVVDGDCRVYNLCGSYFQSQSEVYHVRVLILSNDMIPNSL